MPEPLKNMYNQAYVGTLSDAVKNVHTRFDGEGFVHDVFDMHWDERELKERMRHITACLHQHLPDD